MTGFLIDTNVVSELRKPKPHGGVVAWINSVVPQRLFVSAFTLGEIQTGVERLRPNDALEALEIEAWLNGLPAAYHVLPMNDLCFRQWARLTAGKPDTLLRDGFLAATAQVNRLTVATRNRKDFARFNIPLFNPFEFR